MARQRWRPTPRLIEVTAPGAGVDWSRRNDSGGGWLIRVVYARLVASVVVASREPNLRASTGDRNWFRSPVGVAQTASQDVIYCAFGGAVAGAAASNSRLIALPDGGLWLPPGHTIETVTALIDVADQWSLITLDVLEFPDTIPENLLPFPYLYTDSGSE